MQGVAAKVAAMDEKQKKTYALSAVGVLVLVGVVYYVWSPSCASTKSCKDLKADAGGGWPTHNAFYGASGSSGSGLGDEKVCGESQWGLGPDGQKQCYGGVNSVASVSFTTTITNRSEMYPALFFCQMGHSARLAPPTTGRLGAEPNVPLPAPQDAADQGSQVTHGWEHANQVCRDAGARLCTVAELLNEVTRGTGCQHDAEMSWSSETRSDCAGHITVQGGQHRGDEACADECAGHGFASGGNADGVNCATCKCTPRCAPDAKSHAVRCCGDGTPAEAKASCEAYVGYKGVLKPPSPVTNMHGSSATEGPGVAARAASAMCRSVSPCHELRKNYGGWRVGASSANIRAGQVTNGQQVNSGGFNGGYGNNAANTLERSEGGVCGESQHGLGAVNNAGHRTDACWGGTNDGGAGGVSTGVGSHTGIAGTGGADNRISGWAQALSICEGVGARLCTVEEMIAENTRASGCSHDCENVWTSQTSPQCKPNQHIVAQGGLNCGYQICPDQCSAQDYIQGGGETSSCQCTPECANDSESRAVRCCADVFYDLSPTPIDLTAGLEKGGCHFDACVDNPDQNHPSCLIYTPHLHGGGSCPAAQMFGQIAHPGGQSGTGGGAMGAMAQACHNGVRTCGATSSSTMGWNGEPDRAIDGKHCSEWGDGSCTHTDAGAATDPATGPQSFDMNANGTPHGPAWWQVDIGGKANVEKVDVWHRTGCGDALTVDPVTGVTIVPSTCNSRLEGAHIFVSHEKRDQVGKMWSVASCNLSPTCNLCGVLHSSAASQPETITCGVANSIPPPPPPFGQPPPVLTPNPVGRYISIAHVHDADTGHGFGGTSGGWVITICEARVTGRRIEQHVYNNMGDCSTYAGEVRQPPPPPAVCASRKSCAQLHTLYGGWVERTAHNVLPNVCGESDNGLGGCGRNQCFGGVVAGGADLGAGVIEPPHADTATGGWAHANKICKDAGARLCTVAETKAEVGRGTGCQHDGEMVWTSETCDPGITGISDETAHITVQGGLHRGDEACPDECAGAGEASGNCMGGEGYCEQDLTRGLPTRNGQCRFDTCVGNDRAPGTCAIATSNANGGGSCLINADGALQPGQQYPWMPANAQTGPPPPGGWGINGNYANSCVNGKRICGAASSSTVGWGGEPDRAIDATLEESTAWGQGSCTHTDAGNTQERNLDGSLHGPAWWQVDLGQGALVNHVDVMHRTDCCQDRLEHAKIYVSTTPDYKTSGVECSPMSDHTKRPEVSQCNQVYGQYVTVAHDHAEGGGSSGGAIVSICKAQVWGVRGQVDTSLCKCTPRCAQDTLNMAVRCCADSNPKVSR